MRFKPAMQCVRSGNRTFVYGVNFTEVNLAVEEYLQLFVAWSTKNHARHGVAVLTEGPERAGRALITRPRTSFFRSHIYNTNALVTLLARFLKQRPAVRL